MPHTPYRLALAFALAGAGCLASDGVTPDERPGTARSAATESPPAAPDRIGSGRGLASTRDRLDLFSGTVAGRALTQHLKTTLRFDGFAARRYRMSLAGLRRSGPELRRQFAAELIAAYYRLPAADTERRWLLVDTLGELLEPRSLDALAAIAATAVPLERFGVGDGARSSVAEEHSIRFAAVRGISQLASLRQAGADERLLALSRSAPEPAVRVQAAQAYANSGQLALRVASTDGYRRTTAYAQRVADVSRVLPVALQPTVRARPISAQAAPTPAAVLNPTRGRTVSTSAITLVPRR